MSAMHVFTTISCLCLWGVSSVRITAASHGRMDGDSFLAVKTDDVANSSAVNGQQGLMSLVQRTARQRSEGDMAWKPIIDKGSGHWWDPFGSHAPEDLIEDALVQACVFSWAVRFDAISKEESFPRVNKASTLFGLYKYPLNLTEEQMSLGLAKALMEEKDTENQLRAAYGSKKVIETRLKNKLRDMKAIVKSSGFSRAKARFECQETKETPSDNLVRTCVLEASQAGKTFENHDVIHGGLWRKPFERQRRPFPTHDSFKKVLLKNVEEWCIPHDGSLKECIDWKDDRGKVQLANAIREGDLLTLLELRWNYTQTYDVVSKVGTDVLRKQPEWKRTYERYKVEVDRVDHVLGFGFDFYWDPAWAWCEAQLKDSNPSNASKIIKTMISDLSDPVRSDTRSPLGKMFAKCSENKGSYCPEGHGPGNRRHVSWRNFFIWMQVLSNPLTPLGHVDTAIAVYLGTLLNGQQGGFAGFAAVQIIPFTDWLVWAPVALALSVNLFPDCRCWQSECEWREGTCEIQSSKSVGPYKWLPYVGQKCAPVIIPPDEKPLVNGTDEKSGRDTPVCKIQVCDKEDLMTPLPFANVSGIVGQHGASTYNCLAVSGQNLALATGDRRLFVAGEKIEDNAEGRRSLFRILGVPAAEDSIPEQTFEPITEPTAEPISQPMLPQNAGSTTEPSVETTAAPGLFWLP